MKKRHRLGLLLIMWSMFGVVMAVGVISAENAPTESSEVQTFAQSLYAGCYLASANECKIHIEPFEIQVNESQGERAAEWKLVANNVTGGQSFTLANGHTDASYGDKPVGDWSPTLVTQDYHAVCGETYYVNILTRGDRSSTLIGTFGNAGRTGDFECPNALSTPTAIQNSFLGLDENSNLVIPWQIVLLLLPITLWQVVKAYRED